MQYKKSYRQNQAKKKTRELKSRLRLLKKYGIYQPTGDDLTPHRKKQINSYWNKYGHDISGDNLILIEYPEWISNQSRDKIKKNARDLKMTVTPKGIVYRKEGQRRGKIRYDRQHEEFTIELRGKRKFGENAGKYISEYVPLASIDTLASEKQRMTREAQAIGPLKKSERLYFKVKENGVEGMSHSTFSDIDKLLAYLDKYEKTPAGTINFYRHISIEKIEYVDFGRKIEQRINELAARKRSRRKKVNATGRNA